MTVVAVGPQPPEAARALGLPFPVLSDASLEVTRRYGLLHPRGFMGRDAPRPAMILVGPDRIVRWLRPAPDVRTRPAPEEIFEALRTSRSGGTDQKGFRAGGAAAGGLASAASASASSRISRSRAATARRASSAWRVPCRARAASAARRVSAE